MIYCQNNQGSIITPVSVSINSKKDAEIYKKKYLNQNKKHSN